MPHRLLPYIPYPKMFLAGLFSGGSSVLAAALDDRAIAMAMAVVAMGTVLAQPVMRAYDAYRERRRANDAADRQTVTDEYLVVVRSNDERGRTIEKLQLQNADQQKQLDAMKTELDVVRKGAGKAVKQLQDKAEDNAQRIAAVEAQQGSASNLELPTTPADSRP